MTRLIPKRKLETPCVAPTILLGNETEETAGIGRLKADLILQVGEIKHRRVRDVRP